MDFRDASNEAFRVSRAGGVHDPSRLCKDLRCSAIVNVMRSQHADADARCSVLYHRKIERLWPAACSICSLSASRRASRHFVKFQKTTWRWSRKRGLN